MLVPADDLVDLIQKDDAVLLHLAPGLLHHPVHVDEAAGFLLEQVFPGLRDLDFALLGLAGKEVAQHVFEVEVHLLHARGGKDLHHRGGALADFQLHEAVVQASGPEHGSQLFPGFAAVAFLEGGRRNFRATVLRHFDDAFIFEPLMARLRGRAGEQQVQQPLFHRRFGLGLDLVPLFGLDLGHGQFHQVPDHGFHVPAHVAHLGEFGGLDLQERGRR